MPKYILAIDQGTTSSRAIIFTHAGAIVASGQLETTQIFPEPGWVEQDPMEIWATVRETIGIALSRANITYHDLAAVGITNQRETTIVWNRYTGKPVYNAIVWQDTRTLPIIEQLAAAPHEPREHREAHSEHREAHSEHREARDGHGLFHRRNREAAHEDRVSAHHNRETAHQVATGTQQDKADQLPHEAAGLDRYRHITGLPLATYFAGPKVKWILDNVPGARAAAEAGDLIFGTVDSWLMWHLTGGVAGGQHITDVTNASRTLLLDLDTQKWDPRIAADLGIPLAMLPEVRSSSEHYSVGRPQGLLPGVPITGILGDQMAAIVGQACFDIGNAKNTYGTGNFMLLNTGHKKVLSQHGLLTTIAYKFGSGPTTYALEGSIAVTGSLVQWLRDSLGMIETSAEVETLARRVPDNGGCYFVPAFSGLFAPYWQPNARGALVGLTRYVNRNHIARAALESAAYQTREVVDAMAADSGVATSVLKVDGGMTDNELLMQFQADLLGIDVVKPQITETTALGAAYAAGLAVGYWRDLDDLRANWVEGERWRPQMEAAERDRLYRQWKKSRH